MQTFHHPLSPEEESHYLQKAKAGDLSARNILVEYNLRLVAHIVKKYQTGNRSTEDLISIGTIGLIKAINTYDTDKGSKLVTYASRCIENELLMRLRQERKEAREISLYEPIGTDKEGNEISLLDVIESPPIDVVEDCFKHDNLSHLLKHIKNTLSPKEYHVICCRYGLGGQEPLTQREIARDLSISRSYVSRIEKNALRKLRALFPEKQ